MALHEGSKIEAFQSVHFNDDERRVVDEAVQGGLKDKAEAKDLVDAGSEESGRQSERSLTLLRPSSLKTLKKEEEVNGLPAADHMAVRSTAFPWWQEERWKVLFQQAWQSGRR